MTDAELDAIKAAEDMRAWHELNRQDPGAVAAVALMRQVISTLVEAEQTLVDAAEQVDNTPESDRIISLMRDAEELECNIRTQIERMK